MKKRSAFTLLACAILTCSAFAQSPTFTATPSTQTVDLSSTNLFNVTISLTGDPANTIGFDLYLATAIANSGFFSITSATPSVGSPFTSPTSAPPFGTPAYPDALVTANSTTGLFAENRFSQGFATNGPPTTYNGSLETLQLSVNAGTPNGTYTFQTTTVATSGNNRFSSVSTLDPATGTGGTVAANPATFSITVVPEPSTWSLMALTGLGTVGLTYLRRRRI